MMVFKQLKNIECIFMSYIPLLSALVLNEEHNLKGNPLNP